MMLLKNEPHHDKTCFLHMVTVQLISLCFHYIDSTISLLSKSEISSVCPSSVAVQPVFVGPGDKFSHDVAQGLLCF